MNLTINRPTHLGRPAVLILVRPPFRQREPCARPVAKSVSRSVLAGALCAALGGSSCSSALAQGEPPAQVPILYVWGFQSGCEAKADITKNVIDRLAMEHGFRIERLQAADGTPLPACPGPVQASGAGCIAAINAACPGGSGLVLGGVISRKEQATRIRLWLYDLQRQAQALQDDYCQQCDPDDSKVLTAHAAALLARPSFGMQEAPQPRYCQSEPARESRAARPGALFLGVFGSGAHRETFRRELLRRIGLKRSAQGQQAPTSTEHKGADSGTFEKITQGQEGAQVLRVELEAASAALSLWDQRSRRLATRAVECTDGCRDGLERIAQAAAELLDVCFEDRCAAVQPGEHRPPEACTTFEGAVCPALSAASAGMSRGGLDPGTARRIEALVGLGVGLGAATAAGMWIASRNVGVTARSPDGKTEYVVKDALDAPAAVTTGLAAGLAILSIPIFVYVERAKRAHPAPAAATGATSPLSGALKCPAAGAQSAGPLPRSRP